MLEKGRGWSFRDKKGRFNRYERVPAGAWSMGKSYPKRERTIFERSSKVPRRHTFSLSWSAAERKMHSSNGNPNRLKRR